MRATDILTQTPQGLYCPLGDFHVDPVRPVPRALVTHGHSDHARAGHGAVLATSETLAIMAARYGADFAGATQAAALGETIRQGGVSVRFVPAGHVLGSAQIVIEAGPTRLVVSGDYKRGYDPTCLPCEIVPCDVFITEATFGLPVFRHPDVRAEVDKLLASLALFPDRCASELALTAWAKGARGDGRSWAAYGRIYDPEVPIYITRVWRSVCVPLQESGLASEGRLVVKGGPPADRERSSAGPRFIVLPALRPSRMVLVAQASSPTPVRRLRLGLMHGM